MSRLTTLLPLLAALAAAPALAQDEDTKSEAVPGLDTGQPVVQGASDGTFIRETVGDWQIKCLKDKADNEHCQMYQLLRDEEGNNVAEANIFRVDTGGQVVAGATIVVPLETLLTEGLTMTVDGGAGKRYAFAFCNQIGCFSRVGFTQEDVDTFKRGNAATLMIVPALAPDQRVPVTMSLTGFTKGFDMITAIPRQ